MKTAKWLLAMVLFVIVGLHSHVAISGPTTDSDVPEGCGVNDLGQVICSHYCKEFTLKDIPTADLFSLTFPVDISGSVKALDPAKDLTQNYNNSIDQAWCDASGAPDYPSTQCTTYKDSLCQQDSNGKDCTDFLHRHVFWGHDGLDIGTKPHPQSVPVKASVPMLIVASHKWNKNDKIKGLWGESVIGATRVSRFSEEILTFHFHHLYAKYPTSSSQLYVPSRRVNACDSVLQDAVLGWSGETGFTSSNNYSDAKNAGGIHLHLSIRRWKNLKQLLATIQDKDHLYGPGYVRNNHFKLNGLQDPKHPNSNDPGKPNIGQFLDPLRFFQGRFQEDDLNDPTITWLKDAKNLRTLGAEFGDYDGKFDAPAPVRRSDAVRWLNVLTGQPIPLSWTVAQMPPFFSGDTPKSSDYFQYVQNMGMYPYPFLSILDKNANIVNGKHHFLPDDNTTRAAAIKWVVLGFYASDYLDYIAKNYPLTTYFTDVSPTSWYEPYISYGVSRHLVPATTTTFHPDDTVKRSEFAQWIMAGYQHVHGPIKNPCDSVNCTGDNSYCSQGVCYTLTECVTSESNPCPVGGGNDPCSTSPECLMGQTQNQSCNGSGTQSRACQSDCTWGPWDTCQSAGVCTPNQTAACGNCGFQTCDINGNWGACQNNGVCSIGQTQSQGCNGSGIQSRSCDGSCNWGPWSTCSVTPCQDVYLPTGTSGCYPNNGGPTLCLNIQQISGPTWQYQVCKQGGGFLNNYQTVLHDENNLPQLGDTYFGNAGDTCTPWRIFSVSYVSGYGTLPEAEIRATVLSPASCTQSACTYFTGALGIHKECL